jgi:hypothetical protein
MRKIALLLALVAVTACGSDSSTAPKADATVVFKIDALTCTGSGAIEFFIDGSPVGTETLSAGQSSQGYRTSGGQHILGARLANSSFIWPNTTVTVPAGGTFNELLPCS